MVHMPNPQFAMEKQLIISRQQGGPYTIDELEEDYNYSELCLCTPFKFFMFLVLVGGIVVGSLYADGYFDTKTSSSGTSADQDLSSTIFLTTFQPGDGNGSGASTIGSPTNDFVDTLPDPLPIVTRKTGACDPSACVVSTPIHQHKTTHRERETACVCVCGVCVRGNGETTRHTPHTTVCSFV